MTELQERAAVVDEAMSWLRTPYANSQNVKGHGVDCARFPLAVYTAVGIIPPTEVPTYPPDWNMHRNDEIYLDWVTKFATEFGQKRAGSYDIVGRAPLPGDFVLWRWGRTYSHGGIVTAGTQIIHSVRNIGVTLDDMQSHEELRVRPARLFSVWG